MNGYGEYQRLRIFNEEGDAARGDYIVGGIVFRLNQGYPDDCKVNGIGVLPAIESLDGTLVEHWKEGHLLEEKDE